MMKIIYEFPEDGPQNFYTASGFVNMQVVNGKLELETEPGEALLALIEQYEGKRAEDKKPKIKAVKTEDEKVDS